MTLNPFVYGSASNPSCFDEASPCILEQTSMCVISLTQKGDSTSKFPGQDKYVPWLVCMDSSGDQTTKCHKQVGVDPNAVSECLKSDAPELLKQYLAVDKNIKGTPTVTINGKNVVASYKAIQKAICSADPSLKGCSAELPAWGGLQPDMDLVPEVVV